MSIGSYRRQNENISQETLRLLRIALHATATALPHAVEVVDSGKAHHEYRPYLARPEHDRLYRGRRRHGGIVVYITTVEDMSYVSAHYLDDLRAEYAQDAEHVPTKYREAVERLAAARDQTTLPD
jgi:hypothetical protein